MNNSGNEFRNAIDKAYTTQPNVKLNSNTIGDVLKYKEGFTEEVDEDGNEYETFLSKSKKLKKSAKDQFNKDLSRDEDFLDFKKNAQYKDERGTAYSFGIPHASH